MTRWADYGGDGWLIVPTIAGLMILALVMGACPAPRPTPSPGATSTPEPTATPGPTPEEVACGAGGRPTEAQAWTRAADPDGIGTHRNALQLAMDDIGNPCLLPKEQRPEPEVSLEAIASELVLMGRCAGRMTDSVFIRRSVDDGESLWEEYHPVYFGDGCWTSATMKGLHWRAER